MSFGTYYWVNPFLVLFKGFPQVVISQGNGLRIIQGHPFFFNDFFRLQPPGRCLQLVSTYKSKIVASDVMSPVQRASTRKYFIGKIWNAYINLILLTNKSFWKKQYKHQDQKCIDSSAFCNNKLFSIITSPE